MRAPRKWPDGHSFAFTIFDDTDLATVENTKPVYDLLETLGFRTTKSVWPLEPVNDPYIGGSTCTDPEYLCWVRRLQAVGFEIGYHNATNGSSTRERALEGLEKFNEYFGHYPFSYTSHADCAESMYWAEHRVSGIHSWLYRGLKRFQNDAYFRGHIEGDPHFWGDACSAKVKYVRNFVYGDINTLKVCPEMPYHDPDRRHVNAWFASSEGADVRSFIRTVSEGNQDRLENEGGACIMYTHFGAGFVENGVVDARFRCVMEALRRKNGWFPTVTELLDYLAEANGITHLDKRQRRRLERRWLLHKMRVGPN